MSTLWRSSTATASTGAPIPGHCRPVPAAEAAELNPGDATSDRRQTVWSFASLAVAVASLLMVQTLAGVWSASTTAVVAALGLLGGAVLVPLVMRAGRGLVAGFGLTAVGVGQALVVRTTTPPSLLVVVLGLW